MQIESAETDPSASAGNCYYIIRLLSVNVRSKCHWDIICYLIGMHYSTYS